MNCKTPIKNKTISREEAIALYNAIDLQLLKEAPISSSDAKLLVKSMDMPLDKLPNENALDILELANNPAFANLLLYSFIPDDSKVLSENPLVNQKRNTHLKIVDLIAKRSGVDRPYVQKHLRNVLVDGYGKNPETLLHEVSKENGLGIAPAIVAGIISIAPSIASLFGGSPEDKSTVGFQNFVNSVDRGSLFPNKEEMLKASTWYGQKINERAFFGGQNQGADRNYYEAISNTYNESDGTFVRGDWRGVVTSLTPIKFKNFKGSGENFEVATEINSLVLERAYAKQTVPATTDWTKKPSTVNNITQDPAYKPNPTETPWYKNPWIIGGSILGTAVVGVGGYALLSDKK